MLKSVEIEADEKGFTVWIKEQGSRHWLLDASYIKKDGIVRLGCSGKWKHKAVFNKNNNSIKIVKVN